MIRSGHRTVSPRCSLSVSANLHSKPVMGNTETNTLSKFRQAHVNKQEAGTVGLRTVLSLGSLVLAGTVTVLNSRNGSAATADSWWNLK